MFPFFNNYPGSDLHEIDLAYILKLCAELRASNTTLTAWKAQHEAEYEELNNKVEGLINNLVDVIEPWDSSVAYHVYSLVSWQGVNYIAIKDVPVGAMITDTNYWQPANTIIEQINAIGVITSELQDAVENRLYYVTPEEYGAVGDGVTDDTQAIQAALNDSLHYVKFYNNKTYLVTDTLRLPADIVIDLNDSTIISTVRHTFFNFDTDSTYTGYNGRGNITIKNGIIIGCGMSFIHAENILLDNLQMLNALNDHTVEICACKNFNIRNCILSGMAQQAEGLAMEYINIDPCYHGNFPWLTEGSVTFDGTINEDITITNCHLFVPASGDYAHGAYGIGIHSTGEVTENYHKNITVDNCIIEDFTEVNIRLSDTINAVIKNNIIRYLKYGSSFAVGYTKHLTIINNQFVNLDNSANRRPIILGGTGGEWATIFGNTYDKTEALIQIAPISMDSAWTFQYLEKTLIWTGNENTLNAGNFDLTNLNEFTAVMGAPGSGTFQEVNFRGFFGRGLVVGETYPVTMIISDTPTTVKFSITDAHTMTKNVAINFRGLLAGRRV